MKTNILIDTSIVLDGVENITSIDKNSNVFVTDIVLREIDGNKGAEGAKGYNAREFFRQFNSNAFTTLQAIPFTDKGLKQGDTLTQGSINSGAHVFTLTRKWYRSKDINDTKIIEIANDYDLKLCTLDQAQSARAKSIGVEAEIYKGEIVNRSHLDIILFALVMTTLFSFMNSGAYFHTFLFLFVFFMIVGELFIEKSSEHGNKPLQKKDLAASINPATGLPTIGGFIGGVDVAGNTYGSSGEMVSAFEIGI